MKKILLVLLTGAVALGFISVTKDQVIKLVVTQVASESVGAPVRMDGLSFGILASSIRISGLKVYNPAGFPRGILVSCPVIHVVYDLGALVGGKLHLPLAEIDLREMCLEKNKEGRLNVDALSAAKQQPNKRAKSVALQIDWLNLAIGKVVYKDYSAGAVPEVRVYEVNMHKSYRDIASAQQLAALISVEPMKAAGIKGAEIYGVAMLAGVGILPVAVAVPFAGKDSARQSFAVDSGRAYAVSLEVMRRMGTVTRDDAARGVAAAQINGASVTLKLKKTADNKAEIIVSARKYMLPKPDIAGGVLYEISGKLQ